MSFRHTDADDDDRKSMSRCAHDGIDCLLHICDNAVGQDHHDAVILVTLRDFSIFCRNCGGGVDDLTEIGGPTKAEAAASHCVLVRRERTFNSCDISIPGLKIEGEAV